MNWRTEEWGESAREYHQARGKQKREQVDANTADENQRKDKERIADKLIKIATEKSYCGAGSTREAGGLFHTRDKIAYADIGIFGWRETWPVRSRNFRHWLVRIYYQMTGMAPNSEALQTALALTEARAFFDGPEREVFTRVGGANGKIYIDLANESWESIEIGSVGWRVLTSKQVPVRFRRASGLLPLSAPQAGGSVDDLRSFLNVRSDDDFALVLAWLLGAMRDRGPYPVLALMGEQGSAKSTLATILRSLVDPNTAALRSFPREDRDLYIAASNGWIVGYDNVSRVPPWLSDALCRLATGGGFSTRKLYTDDEEQLFNAQRPVVLNGIEDFVNRPDLADRTIFLTLEPIPEEKRKAEQALQNELDRVRPQILGALLDLIVVGLQRLPRVRLTRLPRMADFALWGTACEREPGAFMRAYENNRAGAVEVILEADLVATAVRRFMDERDQEWTGTSTQLLTVLGEHIEEELRRSKDWPRTPEGLSGRLRRAATNLRKVGIEVIENRRSSKQRTFTLRGPEKLPAQPSQPSFSEGTKGVDSDGQVMVGDDRVADNQLGEEPMTVEPRVLSQPQQQASSNIPLNAEGNDSHDSRDGLLQTKSGQEPVCRRCGIVGDVTYGQLIRTGQDGAAGQYHPRCWTEERRRRQVANDRPQPNLQGPEVAGIRPNVLDVSNLSVAGENGGGVHRCDHCGQQGAIGRYDWPHRPFGISLHSSCEGPWFDSEGRR
jgi:hypothetical protein